MDRLPTAVTGPHLHPGDLGERPVPQVTHPQEWAQVSLSVGCPWQRPPLCAEQISGSGHFLRWVQPWVSLFCSGGSAQESLPEGSPVQVTGLSTRGAPPSVQPTLLRPLDTAAEAWQSPNYPQNSPGLQTWPLEGTLTCGFLGTKQSGGTAAAVPTGNGRSPNPQTDPLTPKGTDRGAGRLGA